MFTGIIESLGKVKNLQPEGSNLHLTIETALSPELKIDQSVAHNGVCLTVVETSNEFYVVTAIDETLKRSNLGKLQKGDLINLERCMQMNGRLDGHIVQGHVDTTATCVKVENENGSWQYFFKYMPKENHITVEKGSITVNGVSLTVVYSTEEEFSVAIIPYTYEHTNFKSIKPGIKVNIEFDIIGKYVAKLLENRK